jgi:hypothetical protein
VCWQARDGSQLGELEDDALYLTAAKSLAETGTYKISSLPDQPYQTKYPPLYPLLLSAVWKLAPSFPGNLKWFVLLNWCLWAGFLGIAFQAFRALQLDPIARWAALVLLASNAAGQFFTIYLMPDALFSTLVIGAILMGERASSSLHPGKAALWSGLAAGCAFLTKTSAFPLAITIPVVFLFRRQCRQAGYFVAVMAPLVLGWSTWSALHRQHTTDTGILFYVDYLEFYRRNVSWHDLPSLISYNFGYLQGMFRFALPSFSGIGGQARIPAVLLIPTALSIIGAVRLLRRARFLHGASFCVLYLVQLLVWNFNPRGRFLYPLLPFLAAGLVSEVAFVIDVILKSLVLQRESLAAYLRRLALGSIVMLSLLASTANARVFGTDGVSKSRHNRSGLAMAYHWLDENIPKGAGVVAYDDGGLYLFTGRPAIRSQGMTRPSVLNDKTGMQQPITKIADFARAHRFSYVLWNADDYDIDNDAALHLLALNGGLNVVYQGQGIRIYRVSPPAVQSH